MPENTQQLIMVQASGSSAEVILYERCGPHWNVLRQTTGVVGKNGISMESREGDYRTPQGVFPLGFSFGTEHLEGLQLEYRMVNANCYWVDDPESVYYNQWVESDTVRWNSAEHLADYPRAYHYAVVIEYNMSPVVPYAGSAIFLHCQTGSNTAGCVAIPEHEMLYVLNWLDPSKEPMIMIVPK